MKHLYRTLLIICMISVIPMATSTTSYACSCAQPFSVEDELQRKTAIFSGKVKNITEEKNLFGGSSTDPVTVLFEVTNTWKGVKETEVMVQTAKHEASCGYEFKKNVEYLVYAYGDDNLETGFCERTKPLTNAGEDLLVLGQGEPPAENNSNELVPSDNSSHFMGWLFAIVILSIISIFLLKRRIRK